MRNSNELIKMKTGSISYPAICGDLDGDNMETRLKIPSMDRTQYHQTLPRVIAPTESAHSSTALLESLVSHLDYVGLQNRLLLYQVCAAVTSVNPERTGHMSRLTRFSLIIIGHVYFQEYLIQ